MNVLKVLFDGILVATLTSVHFVEKGGRGGKRRAKKKKESDAMYVSICFISVASLQANFFNRTNNFR